LMSEVAQAAGEDAIVLSVQNGIDTEDEIARHIPPGNAWRMVVNYAGMIDQSGVSKVSWFNPPNFSGPLVDQDDKRMARLVEKRAWLKTILNSALMPVCAVMHLTMKEAMEGRATRRLAADLLDEGLAVAARLGYEYGDDIFEKCMGYLDKGGNHHPSMSIDLSNSRPTEIDFINGKILEVGRQLGDVNVEVNRVFVTLVMTQEVRNGTRKPEDFPEYLVGA
jgi:2-dehydropantoate 2-reductase